MVFSKTVFGVYLKFTGATALILGTEMPHVVLVI